MRALLSGNISCVRAPSNGRFVIGLRPAVERVGLFVLGLGLLLLGLPLAILLDTRDIDVVSFLPGTLLAAVSCKLLFLQPKLLFDRPAGQFWLVRPFRKTRQWQLENVQEIELLRAWKLEDMKLVLKDGERLLIFQTRSGQSENAAAQIAAFLNVPVVRRNLT